MKHENTFEQIICWFFVGAYTKKINESCIKTKCNNCCCWTTFVIVFIYTCICNIEYWTRYNIKLNLFEEKKNKFRVYICELWTRIQWYLSWDIVVAHVIYKFYFIRFICLFFSFSLCFVVLVKTEWILVVVVAVVVCARYRFNSSTILLLPKNKNIHGIAFVCC